MIKEGILYLHPELDVLHLSPGNSSSHFVDFLTTIRTQDPRGVGLTNLAMHNNNINQLTGMDISTLDSIQKTSLKTSITNLRSLFFLSLESAGRMHTGPRNGIHHIRRYEMHRSRPVFSLTPSFERVGRDPRSIHRDLKKVFVGTFDPRGMIYKWLRLLDEWDVGSRINIQYQFLVSCSPGGSSNPGVIFDRDSAAQWLVDEDDRWRERQRRDAHLITRRGGRVPVERPEELEQAPRPAVGFWLFSVEALGPMPDHPRYDSHARSFKAKRVLDMSEHWPELCLSVLP